MLKFLSGKRLIIFATLAIFCLLPTIVKSVDWQNDFQYRKSITLHNSNSSGLTNYQIRLLVHQGTGTDNGSNIYLNNKVLSNFNDIRFTPADGETLLDYWIESINAGVATVWIEVHSIQPVGTTQLFIYYGNSGANSQSNGFAVFPFFDNFDQNGISNWIASTEDLDHADEIGNQNQTINTTYYVSSPNSAHMRTYASCLTGPFNGVKSLITSSPNLSSGSYVVDFDVKLQITGFRFSTTGVQRTRVRINGSEQFYDEISCNGSNCTAEGDWSHEAFTLSNTAINSIALVGDSYDCANGNTFYDNLRIRNYTSTEPQIIGMGQEELLHISSSSSVASSSTTTPSCSTLAPAGTPDLFQINTTNNTATIYFTPLLDTNKYYISFSTKPIAEEHGIEVSLGNNGVQNYTLNYLAPGTEYYFKVRGQQGCMPGSWSNIKKAITKRTATTYTNKKAR